jgi:hypothetical protein
MSDPDKKEQQKQAQEAAKAYEELKRSGDEADKSAERRDR